MTSKALNHIISILTALNKRNDINDNTMIIKDDSTILDLDELLTEEVKRIYSLLSNNNKILSIDKEGDLILL